MNVLLTMTFAGSLMMAVYILLRLVLDEKFYPTLRHVCLSISMVYFLIPSPLFWEGYRLCHIKYLINETDCIYPKQKLAIVFVFYNRACFYCI